MFLNDQASNKERQRLLPFVMRLACADSKKIEQKRQTYISSKMLRYMSLDRGIEVLEGALAIGRQADPIAVPMLEERMSSAREKVSSASPKTRKAKKPLLTSLKNLLNAL
jgi:hypothetical protein